MNQDQFDKLNQFGQTNRAVQPLNGRKLYLSDEASFFSASVALAVSATLAIFQ